MSRQGPGTTSEKPHAASGGLLGGLRLLVRAFRYRNYRLFFAGQLVSLIGTWMQMIAASWLVYRLTGSPLLLGVIGFLSQIPALLLSPVAGVAADRWDRRRIQLITQTLSMLQAFLLAWLVLGGSVQVWHLMVLSACLGVITAFDIPARQAFVSDMVERREDLGNAIALNSTMFNAARLVGPSIAGVLVATTGEGICFLINGFSYLAAIAALLLMTTTRREPGSRIANVHTHVLEGFSYAWRFAPVRHILALLALVSLVGLPYTVLLPIVARVILGGGPETLGFLVASSGIGAVLAGLYLASQRTVIGLCLRVAVSAVIFSIGLILFAYSDSFFLSLGLMMIEGFGMMILMAGSNTLIQTLVDEDKRGRVMSLFAMTFLGMTPFGSLAAGWLAGVIGVVGTLACAGVLSLTGALLFARHLPSIRRTVLKTLATRRICDLAGAVPLDTPG
jgi:MFS family permease